METRFERKWNLTPEQRIVNRVSLMSDSGGGGSGSGSGDALSSILGNVGKVAGIASQIQTATQPVATPSPIYSNVSAHAPAAGNTSIIVVIVLLIIGFFAFRELA